MSKQLFNVQFKPKSGPNKGKWVNVKRKHRGKTTDEFPWRKAKGLTRRFTKAGATARMRVVRMTPKQRLRKRKMRERALIAQWLRGDLDARHDIMYRLAKVARDLGHTLYVAEGKRTVAEQWKYWWAYKRGTGPLAAYPGTSNHTWGRALDVRKGPDRNSGNLGDLPGVRVIMRRHGLCLPVRGETWHTEIGVVWRA